MNTLQTIHDALRHGGLTSYAFFEVSPTKMYLFIKSNKICISVVDKDLVCVDNDGVARLSDKDVPNRLVNRVNTNVSIAFTNNS